MVIEGPNAFATCRVPECERGGRKLGSTNVANALCKV